MQFTVSGKIRLKEERAFQRKVEAKTERHARDLIYAYFGSKNGLTRNRITIEKVQKVAA